MASDSTQALGVFDMTLGLSSLDLRNHQKGDIIDSLNPMESEDGSSTSPSESLRRMSTSSDSFASMSDSEPLTIDVPNQKNIFLMQQNQTSGPLMDVSKSFSAQNAFLLFLEPSPVSPPLYETLPPGGCPKYHVMDTPLKNEVIPAYTPAAYKITVACRKSEWLSPYEASLNRSWKNIVVELNSTQLNMYQIPTMLESSFLNFQRDEDTDEFLDTIHVMNDDNLMSSVTTDRDIKFRNLCDAICYFEPDTPEHRSDRPKFLSNKNAKSPSQGKLIRSYSLQYAKIGLATDYTKKSNVLRLRLENEQFLLEFSSAKELIEWNLGLSIGRDVSPDIQQREDPRYRTVPRRRRTQFVGSTFYYDAISRKNRSQSDSAYDGRSHGMRNRFSKLKGKLSSPTSFSNIKAVTHAQKNALKQQHQAKQLKKETSSANSLSAQLDLNRSRAYSTVSNSSSFTNDSEDAPRDLTSTVLPNFGQSVNDDDFYGEDDILNISDLQRSDDEEEFELLIEELQDEFSPVSLKCRNAINSVSDEHKWEPPRKVDSQRRFIRNCLKCIKPLLFDEMWVNKLLVKPASISPLSLMYIRNIFCADSSRAVSHLSSTLNLPVGSVVDLTNLDRIGMANKKAATSKQNVLTLPEVSLARMKNHNLREYIVGLHSLIPKDI